MSYYKVIYKVDSYDTPHSRYYHADGTDTAKDMFNATCEQSLIGEVVDVVKIVEVEERDELIQECGCGDPECK